MGRLFFSVAWEGAAARMKHRMEGHKEAHSTTVSRARKRGLAPASPESRRSPGKASGAPDSSEDSDDTEDGAPAQAGKTKPRKPRRHAKPLVRRGEARPGAA